MKTTYQPRPFREHAPRRQSKTAREIQNELELMHRMAGRRGLNHKRMGAEMRFLMIWTLAGLATLLFVGAIFTF
jgi:hypothetical protein